MKKKILSSLLMGVLLITSLTACGSTQSATANQSSGEKTYVVGICQLLEHEALDQATKGFVDELQKRLGSKVKIETKLAQGEPNNCALIVNDFVSKNVDLIMCNATPALQAAVSGTADIPILGTSVTEYGTALGIDNFNGTVGTNVSGTSDLAPLTEQAKMIKDIFPDTKNVGLIYCSSEANSLYQVKKVKEELAKLGIEGHEFPFSDSNDLATIVQNAISSEDVIYVPTDNTAAANAGIIDNICRPAKVPVVAGEEGVCKNAGTVTLSISYYDLGTKTGEMAADILTGAKDIKTMPIEYAPQVTKKYNKTICDELGVSVPSDYIAIE